VGITEVLKSHSQPMSNKELRDLTEQQNEVEDKEDRGTKQMETKDRTDILSAIDMAAEKLCDIEPDWERSPTVKTGVRAMLHPYHEIRQENKKKIKTVYVTFFLDVF
jgi:hypothetical protein